MSSLCIPSLKNRALLKDQAFAQEYAGSTLEDGPLPIAISSR